jgi:hypothetical protein
LNNQRSTYLTGKNGRLAVLFFFAAFLITGLFIFKDYGISWDEQFQWKNNGAANYDFAVHGNKTALLNGVDKYHGPAFELLLTGFEKLFRLSDTRTVFLWRHLLTFFTFYLSSIFFYLLALKIFNSRVLAFAGVLFYVLSPHIFSHAFYNSKDIVFLSLFTISMYCMLIFLEKQTGFRALAFAFVTAFTIDVRIIGILIPFLFMYILLTGWLWRKQIFSWRLTLFYFLCLLPLIVLFWPVLWIDPLFHFKEALKENSNYPWDDPVLYFGKEYRPTELPWHYLFFWMFVSRPVLYSVFFIAGVSALTWKLLCKPVSFIREQMNEQIVLVWFFLPLLAMLVFKSPAFDTGRHLYFLHGGFVLLMLYGFELLWNYSGRWKPGRRMLSGITGFSVLWLVISMIQLHPFEQLYFNITQGTDEARIKSRFEYDYWGLSGREMLEQLVRTDTSTLIVVQAEHLPGKTNAYLLPAADRRRIRFATAGEQADYFLADYRWKKEGDYPFHTEVFSKMNGNAKVATLFKVHSVGELYKMHGRKLLSFQQDFEHPQKEWETHSVAQPSFGAHSGSSAVKVDSVIRYSDNFVLADAKELTGNKPLLLKTSAWIHDAEPGSAAWYVISLVTKAGVPYFWYPLNTLKNEHRKPAGSWEEIRGAVELPVIRCKDDQVRIYLENAGNKEIWMDDVYISLEEEPTE